MIFMLILQILTWLYNFCLTLPSCYALHGASQAALVVENVPANAGDIRDMDSIPGSGRSPGGRAWQPTPVFWPGESHGQ